MIWLRTYLGKDSNKKKFDEVAWVIMKMSPSMVPTGTSSSPWPRWGCWAPWSRCLWPALRRSGWRAWRWPWCTRVCSPSTWLTGSWPQTHRGTTSWTATEKGCFQPWDIFLFILPVRECYIYNRIETLSLRFQEYHGDETCLSLIKLCPSSWWCCGCCCCGLLWCGSVWATPSPSSCLPLAV